MVADGTRWGRGGDGAAEWEQRGVTAVKEDGRKGWEREEKDGGDKADEGRKANPVRATGAGRI